MKKKLHGQKQANQYKVRIIKPSSIRAKTHRRVKLDLKPIVPPTTYKRPLREEKKNHIHSKSDQILTCYLLTQRIGFLSHFKKVQEFPTYLSKTYFQSKKNKFSIYFTFVKELENTISFQALQMVQTMTCQIIEKLLLDFSLSG